MRDLLLVKLCNFVFISYLKNIKFFSDVYRVPNYITKFIVKK